MEKHIRVENDNFIFHWISQQNVDWHFNANPERLSEKKKPQHSMVLCHINAGLFASLTVVTEAGNQASREENNNPRQGNQGLLFDQKAMDCIASLISTQVRCAQSS